MKKISIIKIIIQLVFVWLLLQVGNIVSGLIEAIIYIPGSIIGMLLLLLLLLTKVIKTDHIEESSGFLLKHMGFFYIPLGVSLINSVDLFQDIWMELLAILVISCVLVMFVTSKVTEVLINVMERKGKE